jgi:hypothetical protein
MATTREKAEAILQDVLPRLEALKDEALTAIEEVRKDASAKVSRHDAAVEELEGVEARLIMLQAEKEGLPVDHSCAVLADDVEAELAVKERFATISEEIEGLEDRRASLGGEIRRLCPRGRGHHYDAMIEHTSRVAGTASEERAALEELQKLLAEALEKTVEPVAKVHNDNRALVETRSRERRWDEAAESRAGVGA